MPATPPAPWPASHHSRALHTAPTDQLMARMRLRSKRSIRSPAGSSRHNMGKNCARPIRQGQRLARDVATCQATTTACTCVATTATTRAIKKKQNRRGGKRWVGPARRWGCFQMWWGRGGCHKRAKFKKVGPCRRGLCGGLEQAKDGVKNAVKRGHRMGAGPARDAIGFLESLLAAAR